VLQGGERRGPLNHGARRAVDPVNFVIPKQIWAVEHPERFYPTIDVAWQEEHLAAEHGA
jgi:hypothetical protein